MEEPKEMMCGEATCRTIPRENKTCIEQVDNELQNNIYTEKFLRNCRIIKNIKTRNNSTSKWRSHFGNSRRKLRQEPASFRPACTDFFFGCLDTHGLAIQF